MKTNGCLEYKGYCGSAEIDTEIHGFHGKVEFIQDLVTFEGASYKKLDREFRAAVDDYLKTCKDAGREPDIPFKGSFNVRVGPELHKQAAIAAKKEGRNLNEVVKDAVERYLKKDGHSEVHYHYEYKTEKTDSFVVDRNRKATGGLVSWNVPALTASPVTRTG